MKRSTIFELLALASWVGTAVMLFELGNWPCLAVWASWNLLAWILSAGHKSLKAGGE